MNRYSLFLMCMVTAMLLVGVAIGGLSVYFSPHLNKGKATLSPEQARVARLYEKYEALPKSTQAALETTANSDVTYAFSEGTNTDTAVPALEKARCRPVVTGIPDLTVYHHHSLRGYGDRIVIVSTKNRNVLRSKEFPSSRSGNQAEVDKIVAAAVEAVRTDRAAKVLVAKASAKK